MRPWKVLALALPLVLSVAACSKKKSGPGGPGPSGWLVGDDGTMLLVESHDEGADVSSYDLGIDTDLLAIACRGAEAAWVTGAAGTLLQTTDGGASWATVASGTDADLRAVAIAGEDHVFVAGAAGVFLVSDDSGASWHQVTGRSVGWTAVATGAAGDFALLAAEDGTLWRYDRADDSLASVWPGTGAVLRGLALTPDGTHAAAVGNDGLFLESADRGLTWSERPMPTSRDLVAVRLSRDASLALAVGSGGAVVRATAFDTELIAIADPRVTLRGLHLSSDGHGSIVGDAGTLYVTHDFAATWTEIDLGVDVGLTGVDALHSEPHL